MIINKPNLVSSNGTVEFQCLIETSQGSKLLWYRVDEQFGNFLADLSDGPLVALIIPAMTLGEDIKILGTISERLFYNLAGPYQHILKQVIPFLHNIKIFAEDIENKSVRAPGVAVGFSGGVDSYCALADHFFAIVPAGYKISHLLYNNVGSHYERGESLFEKRYARLKPVTERIGLPFIKVNSNLDSFYQNNEKLGYAQTHTLRNASVPLVLQRGIGRYMYATDYENKQVFIGASTAIAHINPITMASIATEAVDMLSVGGEYTRVEKTLKIAEIPESYDSLDVCWAARADGSNCSKCPKCLGTLLTLDIAGLLSRYAQSFNLTTYQKQKAKYSAQIIRNTHQMFLTRPTPNLYTEYDHEIAQFAIDRNFKFPKKSYLFAWIDYLHLPKQSISLIEKIIQFKDRVTNRLSIILNSISHRKITKT